MLSFEKKLIYTGYEKKESKKNETYFLINFLGENGKSFTTLCKDIKQSFLEDLPQLTSVSVILQLNQFNNNLNLNLLDIEVV